MKKVLILLLLAALLLPLVSCGKGGEGATTTPASTAFEPEEETELKCTVSPIGFDTAVSIYTKTQRTYLADQPDKATDYGTGVDELSRPAPIVLRWDVDFESGEKCLRYFIVRIWTKADKSDARAFLVGRSEREYRFENAFVGQRYYWDVTAVGADGVTVRSDSKTFLTEDRSFRFLSVDGVTNVRDIGGKNTEDGGRIRQGLLYRGGQLNRENTAVLITDEGIRTMRQTFGVRTELDLRTENEAGASQRSFLGEDVDYVFLPLKSSLDITNSQVRSDLKRIFAVLADRSNYPIFFHCVAGTDRTGLVGWLVNGLCGVSEEDLWRDYMLSNFGTIGGKRETSNIQNKYVNPLKSASGKNLAEQIYNYLKDSVGIPAKDLDSVIRIMKAAPGVSANNTMPAIPAGHIHVPESDYTMIEASTCTCPGIRVKYCSVCGEYIEDTITELPIDPDGHIAGWTVTRQPTVTDQADGSRSGVCVECGRSVEQAVAFAPNVASFTDQSRGLYYSEQINIVDAIKGKHFYPTAGNRSDNDLLIEYSVFYNRTMLNFESDRGPSATTTLNTENVIYWSPSADLPDSWCPYAGGFEGSANFTTPVSDSEVTTPAKIAASGGNYADYPNIGGADQSCPEYGWHRIGIRIHEELTNAAALQADTTAGKTKAKYVVTLTVYFDGAAVYKLKTDESTTGMRAMGNLLYTAASDGKGGIIYTDIDADRYVVPLRLNATTAESGKTVYVATADVSVSCGKDFLMPVEKLASPTPSTLTVAPGETLSAPIYYQLKK